jgi:hypothetical protein
MKGFPVLSTRFKMLVIVESKVQHTAFGVDDNVFCNRNERISSSDFPCSDNWSRSSFSFVIISPENPIRLSILMGIFLLSSGMCKFSHSHSWVYAVDC